MHRHIVAVGMIVFFSAPCLAADEFYVAQDPVAKNCKIVREKPDGKTLIMVGTSPYATRDAAKAVKQAAPECGEGKD